MATTTTEEILARFVGDDSHSSDDDYQTANESDSSDDVADSNHRRRRCQTKKRQKVDAAEQLPVSSQLQQVSSELGSQLPSEATSYEAVTKQYTQQFLSKLRQASCSDADELAAAMSAFCDESFIPMTTRKLIGNRFAVVQGSDGTSTVKPKTIMMYPNIR